MRKTFLTFVLATFSGSAIAEWVMVAQSADVPDRYYVDPQTILNDGAVRRAWVLEGRSAKDDSGVLSYRYLYEFDCKNDRWRMLLITGFGGQMATGPRLTSFEPADSSKYVAPGTVAASMLKYICSQ